jgi:hypothetical protein
MREIFRMNAQASSSDHASVLERFLTGPTAQAVYRTHVWRTLHASRATIAISFALLLAMAIYKHASLAVILPFCLFIILIVALSVEDFLFHLFPSPRSRLARIQSDVIADYVRELVTEPDARHLLTETLRRRLHADLLLRTLRRNDWLEHGIPLLAVEPLDEAIAILKVIHDRIDSDPSYHATIWTTHCTPEEVDDELNFWRSLKAASYLEVQRKLIATGRVTMFRYFLCTAADHGGQRDPNFKALVIMSQHAYWNIRVFHGVLHRSALPAEGDDLLVAHVGRKDDVDYGGGSLSELYNGCAVKLQVTSEQEEGVEYKTSASYTYWSHFVSHRHQILDTLNAFRAYQNQLDSDLAHNVLPADGTVPVTKSFVERRLDILSRADTRAASYRDFCTMRDNIALATDVLAVDVTSLKQTLTVLRQDPGYSQWQEANFRAISDRSQSLPTFRNLTRVFVLRSEANEERTKFNEVLDMYFRRLGRQRDGKLELPDEVSLYYTTEDKVKQRLQKLSAAERTALLAELEGIASRVRALDDRVAAATLDSDRLACLVMRDFLCTESMLYDYINPKAKVDCSGTRDYVLIGQASADFGTLRQQYERIVKFLRDECGATPVFRERAI